MTQSTVRTKGLRGRDQQAAAQVTIRVLQSHPPHWERDHRAGGLLASCLMSGPQRANSTRVRPGGVLSMSRQWENGQWPGAM